MKDFLISIDTEGDNQWAWKSGEKIETENAKFLPRFQELCEEFGFKPTYLTNYEMACDACFTSFAQRTIARSQCEIGMHLHAWNSPPEYPLSNIDANGAQPYLIEYPAEVIEEKISVMTDVLRDRFGSPLSHRAGRWATDETYFHLLNKFGYSVDCSVTPFINWSSAKGASIGSAGSDYRAESTKPHVLIEGQKPLVEVPMTIRNTHHFFMPTTVKPKNIARNAVHAMRGTTIWLRPMKQDTKELIYLLNQVAQDDTCDYAMFMLHSSELMPGGSPLFPDEESVERLYQKIRQLFKAAAGSFQGKTIGQYGMEFVSKKQEGNR